MKSRKLIIGDIHGAYLALQQVLERAEVTSNDTLIFLGDYVDGWSQSKQVIDYLIELEKTNTCVFIKGNHDIWCEEWLMNGKSENVWLFNGGKETIDSYVGSSKEEQEDHLNFFQRMKNYHHDEDNNLFIHAGFTSMQGPQSEKYESNYNWDRTLWEMVVCMDKTISRDSVYFPKRLNKFNEIFIGHTPTIHYGVDTPWNLINLWNIDTGAAFTGKLSVLDASTKQFWQSDSVQLLYPDEKGRNKD